MASAPRPNSKAFKVYVKVMGLPAAMRSYKTQQQKKISQRLNQEEIRRVK